MNKKLSFEGISDVILLILVTVPLIISSIAGAFCSVLNPSFIEGACYLPPLVASLDRGLSDYMFLMGFGGLIFVGPILLVATVASLVPKVKKFVGGYRPQTARAIAKEVFLAIPILSV